MLMYSIICISSQTNHNSSIGQHINITFIVGNSNNHINSFHSLIYGYEPIEYPECPFSSMIIYFRRVTCLRMRIEIRNRIKLITDSWHPTTA